MSLYTAAVTTVGGRAGHARSDDGALDLDFTIPKAMGGESKKGATNPEQLFAAAYSACFGSAALVAAKVTGLKPEEVEITAHVAIDKTPEGAYGLSVRLVGAFKGLSPKDAHTLMEEAHKMCPYSIATRGNVPVTLEVE